MTPDNRITTCSKPGIKETVDGFKYRLQPWGEGNWVHLEKYAHTNDYEQIVQTVTNIISMCMCMYLLSI